MSGYINQGDYQNWIKSRTLRESDLKLYDERASGWKLLPLVHFVVVIKRGEEEELANLIDSLEAQFYRKWRLTIIAAFPAPVVIKGEEVVWVAVRPDADFLEEVNREIRSVSADWVMLALPDVQFEPTYLFSCVSYINIRTDWCLIYTDEDCLAADGVRHNPKFKPDINIDLLRSLSYIGFCLVKRDAVLATEGYSYLSLAGSYDMALKVLDRFGEGAIGHIPDLLYHTPVGGPLSVPEEEQAALSAHLARNHLNATIGPGYAPGTYHIRYQHERTPLVSIIIPTKDRLDLIQPCIDSLLTTTAYPRYEVIVVDNRSTDPAVLDYYEKLKALYPEKIRLLPYRHPFNYSAVNNVAAKEAKGEYLLLLITTRRFSIRIGSIR